MGETENHKSQNNFSYETAKANAVVDVPIAHPEDRVEEIIEKILGKRYASASHIVVLQGGKLVGIITAEDLFSAKPERKAYEIMDKDPPKVTPETDQEVAAWQALEKDEYAIAVVDHYGYFLGLIPPKTLLKILLKEHQEDLSIMAGILSYDKPHIYIQSNVGKRVLLRLPWLVLGLMGGLMAAGVVNVFESELQKQVKLAFFIPTIVYLADAIGTQTEAIVVRSLALKMDMDIAMEVKTASAIGLSLMLFTLVAIFLLWGDSRLALVVSLAIFVASSVAGLIASLLPILLEKLRLDPAHGSGPLATVIQDIVSIVIYFLVCWLLL
ncbi:MAG: magnesium transporter [Acidobacteria bacterium]|jgi:magnesium transporter|nr:MAG: magnesium transporter [Acidobacteriota bacterium]